MYLTTLHFAIVTVILQFDFTKYILQLYILLVLLSFWSLISQNVSYNFTFCYHCCHFTAWFHKTYLATLHFAISVVILHLDFTKNILNFTFCYYCCHFTTWFHKMYPTTLHFAIIVVILQLDFTKCIIELYIFLFLL